MKQLVILSGKGGTGKTSITASLGALTAECVMADCDVDAADLHILTDADGRHSEPFSDQVLARVVSDRCTRCGRCEKACRFDAIHLPAEGEAALVERLSCEGCGLCHDLCPEGAIVLEERLSGELLVSRGSFGPLVHARLGPGEGNSGKLVSLVRERAKEIAERSGLDLVLLDGSPGVGCPVIASLTGVDLVLLVTEPSLAGIHDLERIMDLLDHFRLPGRVMVNKHDLNPRLSERIDELCDRREKPLIGRIPFDPRFTEAMVAGRPITTWCPESPAARTIAEAWESLQADLE